MGMEKKWVVFENAGQKIFGVVHMPTKATEDSPCPAVLIVHGYGGNKCGKNRLYVRIANQLARAGIAVLRFDFRGSGDSDGEFHDMTLDTELSDFHCALNYLKNIPCVDASRIGLLGRSLGGAVTVMGGFEAKGIRALVMWAPVFSGEQWKKDWKKWSSPESLDGELIEFQGQQAHLSFVKQLFSMDLNSQLAKMEGIPLLHFYGEKDDLVDKTHREGYKKVRANASAPSHFVLFKNSDHEFGDIKEQKTMLKETEEWFVKYLGL